MKDRYYMHVPDMRELGRYIHIPYPYDGGYGPYFGMPNPYIHQDDLRLPYNPNTDPQIPYIHQTDGIPYVHQTDANGYESKTIIYFKLQWTARILLLLLFVRHMNDESAK